MEMFKPHRATQEEMTQYHSPDYIDFLKSKVNFKSSYAIEQLERFNFMEHGDCPLFPGIFDFCQISCGGSIDGAIRLNHGLNETCINWSGGLHHARKREAAGFCYTNDIVLAILQLLRYHKRVLYIDIDIHHGDGVEEAFYFSDRVFTCSFHRYGEDFFPGTGAITDFGEQEGRYCCCNFPLKDGLNDEDFMEIFCPVIDRIVDRYEPTVIVLQCGADSLLGDRLGGFCLSAKGHAAAVAHVRNFRLPVLVLGGGGYTSDNVAKTWAYETAILTHIHSNVISNYDPYALNVSSKDAKERGNGKYSSRLCMDDVSRMSLFSEAVSTEIPLTDPFRECYAPTYNLDMRYKFLPTNGNSEETLRKHKRQILQNIDRLKGPPSVQFQDIEVEQKEIERLDEMDRAQEEVLQEDSESD